MGWFSSKPKVAEGPWDFYQYSFGEGLRASITFNVRAAAEEHRSHPHCRRVIFHLPHESVYANGLPDGDEYRRSTEDEAALIGELERAGVDCLKVGHMLYAAMRDIVFQVEDTANFAAVVARWTARASRKIELRESAGWDFFEAKLRPSPVHQKWIENNHVVIELLKAGTNRELLHPLDHNFVGAPPAIDRIAGELERAGFDPQRHEPGRLTMTQELALDPDEITTWTLRFDALAEASAASYDGWGTRVLR